MRRGALIVMALDLAAIVAVCAGVHQLVIGNTPEPMLMAAMVLALASQYGYIRMGKNSP